MGEAKRRGDFATRVAQAKTLRPGLPARPGSQDAYIRVRPCLMSAARRCAVNFRVIPDQPAVFMCQDHWRLVPESARELLRKAAAAHRRGAKPSPEWQLAVKTSVLAVLARLVEIDGGSVPSHVKTARPADAVAEPASTSESNPPATSATESV